MRQFDFAPLYRHSVGFDRMASLFDNILRFEQGQGQAAYPPFNIEKRAENEYRISLAVAGFTPDELSIESKESVLIVTGNKAEEGAEEAEYLHRGIATRAFERRFQLADHVRVVDARMEHGLLHIELEREIPEALKPRKIAISGAKGAKKLAKN